MSTIAPTTDLRVTARRHRARLVALRRQIHGHPEIGLHLPRTQAAILAALHGLPLEIRLGDALSSVTAVLRSGRPGPVVLLRADMDALPVQEASGEQFSSEVEGVMHACGHDLHVAGLVGAAHVLVEHLDDLVGDVVLMFQPGEESYDGARHMIDEGVLTAAGSPIDAAYAVHVFADVPRGSFASRPGPMMAAADSLHVEVHGTGGHGSMPHVSEDPIQAACAMVTTLQTLITRRFDAFDPVVLTVGTFHAGTTRSVIPESAVFEATVRTFSAASRQLAEELLVETCRSIAATHGLEADVAFRRGYPALVTDPVEDAHVSTTVDEVFGPGRHHTMPHPSASSEDFSRICLEAPGAFVFVGAGAGPGAGAPNHSPGARYDEDAILDSAALLAGLAIGRSRRSTEKPDA